MPIVHHVKATIHVHPDGPAACSRTHAWTHGSEFPPLLGRLASVSRVCAAASCSTPRRCVGSTPMLFLVQVLGTS
jgi:hypothetical protein